GLDEPVGDDVEVADREGRMRLLRGREVLGDADVELLRAAREPDAAAGRERRGLRQLLQAEQAGEEAARLRLAAGRRRELHVVEAADHAADATPRTQRPSRPPSIARASSSSAGGAWLAIQEPTSRVSAT